MTQQILFITKRDGSQEKIDYDKIHKVVNWACKGLDNVSTSQVEMMANLQFFEGVTTENIQEMLVKSAADLISEENPNYQYVAARLLMFSMRKKAFGQYEPPTLWKHINNMIDKGLYDKAILDSYTQKEIDTIDTYIDHNKDFNFSYAAMRQLEGKYFVQNRVTGEIYESAQFVYSLIPIVLFSEYKDEERLNLIQRFYNAASDFKLSLPTPIMAGVRTPTRQFSSCFPKGQQVLTNKGLLPIEEVTDDLSVLTLGGTWEKVVLNSNKVSNASSFITLRNTFSIPWDFESTSDHKIKGLKKFHPDNRKKYSVPQWIEAGDLEIGDFVEIPFNKHVTQQKTIDLPVPEGYEVDNDFIKKCTTDSRKRSGEYDDKVQPTPKTIPIDKHLMLILGYFLAEGHVNKKINSFAFTFNVTETNFHNDVRAYFNNLGLHVTEHDIKKNAHTLLVYSLPFKNLLLDLVGTGFDKMKLSNLLMRVEPELQKYLLAGVIRGDGCVHKLGMVLDMNNRTLIHQLGLVALRCGLFPSLGAEDESKNESSWSDKISYKLHLANYSSNRDFIKNYVKKDLDKIDLDTPKQKKYGLAKYIGNRFYAKVLEIRKRPNTGETVYDLSIDNDHSFTVSGIGVHNCTLITSDDTLNSINSTASAIVKYISQRAGIGVNAGKIRALGSSIRNGDAFHTGLIPFLKYFQAAVKSCSQGGLRGGAATTFYPIWHLEVESLLVLKNNRGVEENRVRHMDYGVQLNKTMYERLIKNESITLFSPNEVPGLYEAFFSDQEEFNRLYQIYEADNNIRKKVIKAVDLFTQLSQERAQTGRIYIQNVDHTNSHGAFNAKKAPIYQSNLCVAPETKILTDKGYQVISELENQQVNVWNGKEFSNTTVIKTGENQPLLKVITDSGEVLECTHYHKFYIQKKYARSAVKEIRANELEPGMKLIKYELPVIEGSKTLDNAYINGFYSGDGCNVKGKQRIYLYEQKRKLQKLFTGFIGKWTIQEEYNRIYCHYNDLKDRFFVPNSSYTIKDRLDWIAGYADADGSIYRNGTNQQLVFSSINLPFLKEIQLMVQTLGVQGKIKLCAEEGYHLLPANDGSGENKEYYCNTLYRFLINSTDTQKLLKLGLKLHRLKLVEHVPNRSAKKFVQIKEIIDNGRTDDTYCFTEPKRHMGMFNGILTGQCLEITLPTVPMESMDDPNGEIALCTLAAFNLGKCNTESDIKEVSELIVRGLDAILDYQDYPVKAAEKAKKRRALGVGVTNLAYLIAKNGLKYSDGSANNLVHRTMENIQYYLLKYSNQLAKEQGKCEYFSDTKYAEGILPIDTYKKEIDKVHSQPLLKDWESLREDIAKYGLRNSTLTALMPSETSSQITNATNGIEPPRGLISVKTSKDGILKQVVPEIESLGSKYELLWNIPNNKGYLNLVGIMQKFVDQAISANTNYVPANYPDNMLPITEVIKDILYSYQIGIKTLYYHNTNDGQGEVEDDGCESGACKI